MKKNKVVLLFGATILVMSLVGCTPKSDVVNSVDIIEKFEKMVYDQEINRYDAVEYVDKNISKINDIEISSSMINTFIYSLYENMGVYTNVLYSLQNDFLELEKDLGVDKIDVSVLSKIPDNYRIIKAVLQEFEDNFLILIKNNGSYLLDVDMEKIKKVYSKYINNDTSNYLDFRIEDGKLEIYDMNSDEYNIELLLSSANTICDNLENLEGESQKKNWIQHLYYYLDMIVSKSQRTFLDNEGKILVEKFNKLKEESTKYADTNFGKLIDKYVNLLEKNNYDVNSDEINDYVDEIYGKLESFLVDNK